jgi:CDGSH-type Zn-finger protein
MIQAERNGPYLVTNVPRLSSHLGEPMRATPQMALCRCGGSATKPFCDGTHARIGFTDAKDPKRVPDRRDTYVTGNVVFLAFALARASGFSIPASIVALGSFGLGALAGGGLGSRLGSHRGRLLSFAAGTQALLLAGSVVLAILSGNPVPAGLRYGLIVVHALIVYPLVIAMVITAAVAVATRALGTSDPAWARVSG